MPKKKDLIPSHGYRMQPPPNWKKRTITGEKEITKFLLGHIVVGDETPIPAVDFLKHLIDLHQCPMTACLIFSGMFPRDYAREVSFVFRPIALDYFKKKEAKDAQEKRS